MVIVANEPPYLVCIGNQLPVPSCQFPVKNSRIPQLVIGKHFPIAIPVPAPQGSGRIEHLKQLSAISSQPKTNPCHSERRRFPAGARNLHLQKRRASANLPLAELEPLARALLAVLLPFLAARVTRDHAF